MEVSNGVHNQNIILLFVVIPLLAAFLIALLGKLLKRNFIYLITFLATGSLLFFSLRCFGIVHSLSGSALVYKIGGWIPPFGICLVLDGLSGFMVVVVNLIAFFAVIYSFGYIEKYTDKSKFFTLFFLMLTGMNGLIVTGDLFNMFVFLEIASIASYALVAFGTEAEELEAALKYAIMGTVASSFIFLGIAFLYGFTSTLNMADMSRILSLNSSVWLIPFVSVLFFMGFGLKSALVPFHSWLPDAHSSAPASISAMLSGVLIKALGIYSMARIFFNIFGATPEFLWSLMFFGALSIIIASILMFNQWDIKRLLAYSSISHAGYIVLGLGLGTPLGIFGGIFHLFNHSIFKSLLFLNAGAIDYAAGTRDLKDMSGFKEKMPVTANAGLIGSMAISGIPPLSGFFSKAIIIFACVQSGNFGFALIAVLGSILTLASFMKVHKFAFLGQLKEKYNNIKEVPFAMCFSMAALAILCIAGGILLLPSMRFFINDAVNVLLQGKDYAKIVLEATAK